MRTLTRITLAALAAIFCAHAASAQGPDAWVEVAPGGEIFSARMPKQPSSHPEQASAGELNTYGLRYSAAGDEQSSYLVWSLNDLSDDGMHLRTLEYVSEHLRDGRALYLDQVAALAWQLLIAPEVERLKKENAAPERFAKVGMVYRREFDLDGRPAREYSAGLENERGLVYVCVDDRHVYVVAALGPEAQGPQSKQFVESFSLKINAGVGDAQRADAGAPPTMQVDPMLIKPDLRDIPNGPPTSSAETPPSSGPGAGGGMGTGEGTGVGPGRGTGVGGGDAPADGDRPFTQKEVTQKARITYKSEPGFTEDARKFQVTGTVRIRAILAATGEVKGITVVKGLPHGLTWKAVDAAKRVRFEPAQKDGHAVSQYIVFEYNFNIF
jgi:TonB family protein